MKKGRAMGLSARRVSTGTASRLACVLAAVLVCGSAARGESEANNPTLADSNRPITLSRAAILGVVEGVTEYLPVSSTGHLILTAHAMGLSHFTEESGTFGRKLEKAPGVDAFEIVIQLGAILAVLGLYRKRVAQMLRGLAGKDPQGLKLVGLLLLAFLPAAIVGKLFHHKIEEHLFGPVPVILAMAVGGGLMIIVEHFFWTRRKNAPHTTQVDALRWGQALFIGVAQCLAMWPGTSRSMMTILAGLVIGLDMVTAAEFSFLLALPTLGAATLYSGFTQRHELMLGAGPLGLAVGTIVSAIVAAIAVKAFVKYLTRHGMVPFGVYRILLAGGLCAYFYFAMR